MPTILKRHDPATPGEGQWRIQQLAGFSQPQVARLHSPHRLNPTQLLAAQSRSPQSLCLLPEAL